MSVVKENPSCHRRSRWRPSSSDESDRVGAIGPPTASSSIAALFIPEFVMNQLESDDNLAQLHPPYRGLVVLITETGLRVGDACTLPFDPVLTDSAGWPCLRFASSKMRAEQLVPLSDAGGGGDPRPATPRPRQLPRRVGVAVPVTVGPASAGALRNVLPGVRRLADTASACTTRPAVPQPLPFTASGTPLAPG